jgi:GLPGLI family protein
MKKKLLKNAAYGNIICAAIFVALSTGVLNAQMPMPMPMLPPGIVNDFSQAEVLDKAVFSCRYEEMITMDSVRKNIGERTVMLLEVGDHVSKFFAERDSKDRQDEIIVDKDKQYKLDSIRKLRGYKYTSIALSPNAIFKNYGEKKVTVTAFQFGINRFLSYDEDLEVQDWKLHGDTATVNGYLCRKATCTFRGRNYEAWYAPEIPVSEGPWKFYGLPGLIFKVSDSSGYFSWECISFKNEDQTIDIYRDNKKVVETTKAEVKKLRKAFFDDPYGVLAANGVNIKPAEGETLPVLHDLPMEQE